MRRCVGSNPRAPTIQVGGPSGPPFDDCRRYGGAEVRHRRDQGGEAFAHVLAIGVQTDAVTESEPGDREPSRYSSDFGLPSPPRAIGTKVEIDFAAAKARGGVSQWMRSCSMAHNAAAARVDTLIFV